MQVSFRCIVTLVSLIENTQTTNNSRLIYWNLYLISGERAIPQLSRWNLALRRFHSSLLIAIGASEVLPFRVDKSRRVAGGLWRRTNFRREVLDRQEQLERELGRERLFPNSKRPRRLRHREHRRGSFSHALALETESNLDVRLLPCLRLWPSTHDTFFQTSLWTLAWV